MILTLLGLLLSAGVNVAATVVEDREVCRLNSATSGEWTVSKTIIVHNEKGLDAATFFLGCDGFHSLKSFSGSVQSGDNKPRKIKKDDLISSSYSEGLVDDGKMYGFIPEGHYPLTVKYEYKIGLQKGIASFPSFFPVSDEDVEVVEASYTLDVPEGYGVKSIARGLEYLKETSKGRDCHTWSVRDAAPIALEALMPPFRELIPYLYCSPEEITLGGYKGMQRDWKEVGDWLWQLQEGTRELSEDESARVREMTSACSSDYEKLAVLYGYLREKTRYVSIQLGIGGLRPMLAKEVSHLGYGDCKGLSNYLKSLLAAAGVQSDYYIISTDQADLLPGYASIGQMNHAMLAVPMPSLSDTVWVECTNPSYPLGYRHSDAAGHEVVLVKENGGELVRIPAYADTLSMERQYSDITLLADGTAEMTLRRELQLDLVESYLGFRDLREETRKKKLAFAIKGNANNVTVTSVADNFADYPLQGRSFVPKITIDYTLESGSYANLNGSRMFVPINPYPKQASIQKGKRQNDICVKSPIRYEDIITLHIPEGYTVESLPENVSRDTEWGRFVSEATLSADGKVLIVKQTLSGKPYRQPASAYPSWSAFHRKLNRQYQSTLVLKAN